MRKRVLSAGQSLEPWRPANRRWWIILGLLLALAAFALRTYRLGAQDLWGDEAASLWLSLEGAGQMVQSLARSEPHPPLYPALLWVWLRAAGSSEFAARFPSAVLGVLIVPSLYVLGGRLGGSRAGVVAGLLAATSPFLIWHSQEVRMYASVATLVAISTLCLVGALEGRKGARAGFVVISALAAYTHYYALFVLVAQALFIFYLALRRQVTPRTWLVAYAALAALYLPWVVAASRIFFSYYGAAPGVVDLWRVSVSTWVRLAVGWTVEGRLASAVAVAFLLPLALGAWKGGRAALAAPRSPTVLLALWLLLPMAGGLAVSAVRPMFAERYLIVVAPAYYLLLALGLARSTARPWLTYLGAALVLGVSALSLTSYFGDLRYARSEYSRLTRQMESLIQPGEAAVLDGPSQILMFRYYVRQDVPTYLVPEKPPLDEEATAATLARVLERHSGIWLFLNSTADYDPGSFVEGWLSHNACFAHQRWATNGRLVYYSACTAGETISEESGARAGDRLELVAYTRGSGDFRAGQVVPIVLSWRALSRLDGHLKMVLRLRGPDGFLWGESHAEPAAGFRPTPGWQPGETVEDRRGIRIAAGTPPGEYALELGVYEEGTGQAWEFSSPARAGETRSVLALGTIRVAEPGSVVETEAIADFDPVAAIFGERLELIGYSGSPRIEAGREGYLTLLWRARGEVGEDLSLLVRLIGADGQAWSESVLPLTNSAFSTARWRAADVLRGQYNLAVDPRAPAGEYVVTAALRRPSGEPLPVAAGNDELLLYRVHVLPRRAAGSASIPQVELATTLGGRVLLRGYSLSHSSASPGDTVTLTLYWEARAEIDRSYTVFTHVLDGENRVRAQKDSLPQGGALPTSAWIPGEVVEDRYEIPLPADLAAGFYPVEVGLYEAATGQRLPAFDETTGREAGDRILLGELRVGDPSTGGD